jgi:hypothetical protein
MVNAVQGAVGMFYVLEFFREDEDGDRRKLQSLRYEAPSDEQAVRYAKAFLRNVTVQDKSLSDCRIITGAKVLSVAHFQSTRSAGQELP